MDKLTTDRTLATRRAGTPSAGRKATRAKRVSASLTQRIYERLRSDILTCALEPGRDISEAELAERFEVSKTPVREALATLRSEGFVRTFPRRGYQIVPITIGDMNELFDVRTILEAGTAELACQRISDRELDDLQKLADIAYDRGEQLTLKRFIQANRDFHTAIATASGNARLTQLVVRQLEELERFFYLGARLRDINTEVKSDHHRIVAALRKRDAEAARRIMVDHNEQTRRGLFTALTETRSFGQLALS